MLEALKTDNKAVGLRQVGRALRSGQATSVYLAKDADPKIQDDITQLCERQAVPVLYAETMEALGRACGITVGSATVAILA